MHPETRLTLLVKLRNRSNEQAWEEFNRIYRGYVLGVLRNVGIDDKIRDDVAQDVTLSCWHKLSDFDYDPDQGRFRGWLATVARNAAYDAIRKDARRRNREAAVPTADKLRAEVDEIAEMEWQRHVSELAWETVSQSLAPKVKTTFEHFLTGKTAAEIAEELSLEVNTVHVYKQRVRKKLLMEALRLDDQYG